METAPLLLLLLGFVLTLLLSGEASSNVSRSSSSSSSSSGSSNSTGNTASSSTFTFVNGCPYTVWPGILSNAGIPPLANGGFELGARKSVTLAAPVGWSGRFWGRTGCSFNTGGLGRCLTGDCGNGLQCKGAGATPPATLAEFTLAGPQGPSKLDFYDVSLVDGYNVPIAVWPGKGPLPAVSSGGSSDCGTAGCSADLNPRCPKELQSLVLDGEVGGCKSACLAFGTAQYCCSGLYGSPSTCRPSTYSELFKEACPRAYSYAYDDPTSTFTCRNAPGYTIAFCPNLASERSGVVNAQAYNTQLNSGVPRPSPRGCYPASWYMALLATVTTWVLYLYL